MGPNLPTEILRCSNCSFNWISNVLSRARCTYKVAGKNYCRFCYFMAPSFEGDGSDWVVITVPKTEFYCCRCKYNIIKQHKLSKHVMDTVDLLCRRNFKCHRYCKTCFRWVRRVSPDLLYSRVCCKPKWLERLAQMT